MNDKQKSRYMKRVVALCLLFCAVMVVATYIAAWFAVDTAAVMTCACGLFGGELVMTCVLRLLEDKAGKGTRGSESKPPGEGEGNG